MRSISTGRIYPSRCNSHLCPECSPLHQMTARHAIRSGVIRGMIAGASPIFVTLTEPARATLDMAGFRRRWGATVKRLQRLWGVSEYAVALEFQERGALHPHAVMWADPGVGRDLLDRRTRASYRRRMHELRPMARELGWGQMVDAKTIEGEKGAEEVGKYGAKNVADYATKEAAKRFKQIGARRIRPVRLSRGYYPGGLAAAMEKVREGLRPAEESGRDHGPFERVRELRSCGA